MQLRAQASALRSAVQRFGVRQVAARAGKSESTIRRYLKQKGRFPSEVLGALKTFGSERGVTRKEVKAALRLDPVALAASAGVTVATARRWQKKKQIPKRSQSFLVDIAPEPTPRKLKGYSREYGKNAQFTKGLEILTRVDAFVTSQSIQKMTQWAAQTKIPRLRELPLTGKQKRFARYQFVVVGSSILGPKERVETGSAKETKNPKKLGKGRTQHFMTLHTDDAETKREAIRLLAELLRSVEDQSFLVESVTLWVRYPKSENPSVKVTDGS